MITLIKKDLRQMFWPALLAVLLLVAPTLAWASSVVADGRSMGSWEVFRGLSQCAALGAAASLLASSSIAGVAFARERRERTAELMATLPTARWRIVAAKGTAALIVVVAPVAAGLVALAVFSRLAEIAIWGTDPLVGARLRVIAAAWLLLFGLGWGLSSALRGEVLAAAAPVLVLIVLAAAIATWWQPRYGEMPYEASDRLILTRMAWTFGLVGGTGLVTGTVVSLRRRSP